MATNLTSTQITNWKKSVDSAITTKLVQSLNKAYNDAVQLSKVTTSQDENNLSYRFKDLASVTQEASKQLTTFMKAFDTDLTRYIDTVKKAEADTAEKIRVKIDQFAESANAIKKLTM